MELKHKSKFRPVELPSSFSHRAMYMGQNGFKHWLSFSKQDNIENNVSFCEDILEITKAISAISFSNFISLGPGDAAKDYYIIKNQGNKSINYIPVDINEKLVENACAELATETNVPSGIVADFEADVEFIASEICQSLSGVSVYSLLGNTIGALDMLENSFLNNIEKHIQNQDYILIEIGTLKNSWDFFSDDSSRSLYDDNSFRFLIANALNLKYGNKMEDVVTDFENLIGIRRGNNDILGAISYEFYYRKNNGKIFCLTRYDWKKFLNWIQNYSKTMDVIYQINYYNNYFNFGTGIVILQKKK